jgi:prepilin-type N-terminal cleavage/methylation domain-containing protein
MTGMHLLSNKDGFTLQETLVVLVVGSVLMGLCFSLFLMSSRLVSSWQKRDELRVAGDTIVQRIVSDVQRSKEISARTDSSFVLLMGIDTRIVYTHDAESLYRNEVEIRLPEGAELTLSLLPVVNFPQAKREETMFRISVILKTGDRTYGVEIHMKLRHSATQQFLASSR